MYSLFYNTLIALSLPLLLGRLLWRGRIQPDYRKHWRERLALAALPQAGLWIHAVSVGESAIALHLIERLHQEKSQNMPNLVLSCSTPTGRAAVVRWCQQHPQVRLHCCYLPFDIRSFVNKALGQVQPQALLVIETEVWPNLIDCARVRGIPTILINARMSKKSARGYSRILRFVSPAFAGFDLVLAQTRADAVRLALLGAQKIQITGNIKFDFSVFYDISKMQKTARKLSKRSTVFAIGSSRVGEESLLVKAVDQLLTTQPDALILWAPRHFERSEETIISQLKQLGYSTEKFSQGSFNDQSRIVLVDTFGDLTLIYALADCVFIGGTLVDTGSQNLIEPALLGKPVISGPSHFNFAHAHRVAKASGGLMVVDDQQSLNRSLLQLAGDTELRQKLGKKLQQAMLSCQGATEKTIGCLSDFI